ncbi:hypothetical protein [Microbacterium halotolerans]|uniref:hypothetical protein n=1 Tax=Microbacterium halotolerans TaxID=246613 RepID=UPI000E6AAD43|nr:hypothetical protein [Microbacterium halotolerans]
MTAGNRAQLEERLALLHNLLSQAQEIPARVDAIYAHHARRYLPFRDKWGGGAYIGLVLAGTLALYVVLAIFVFGALMILALIDAVDGQSPGRTWLTDVPLMQLALLVAFALSFFVAAFAVKRHNARLVRANEKIAAQNEQIAQQIQRDITPEMQSLDNQLKTVQRQYRSERFADWFPETYQTLEDVAACWQLVHDHQASTVQEVINVYRQELHNQYLRDAADAQLAEQQRTARAVMLGNVINAAGHAATIGTIRDEGAATRAAMPRVE